MADIWKDLNAKIIEELAQERKKFLSLAGFSAQRQNEVEDTLYIKAAFICKTDLSASEDILDILLADQDVIFTSCDISYRINTINDESNRTWKPLAYDPKRRKGIYYGLSVWGRRSISKEDREIYIAILDKIFTLAAKNHQSIRDWIQTQYPNELPVSEQISILQKIVPDSKITPQICCTLSRDVLPEYITRIETYSKTWYRPTNTLGISYQIPAQLFISYKARLRRLKRLKDEYKCEIDPILGLDHCREFSFHSRNQLPCQEISGHIRGIADYIRGYFAQIDVSLKEDTKDILTGRIVWAMEQGWVPNILKPVFLTFMTICCGRGITSGIEPTPTESPVYDDKIGIPHQRYAQLRLLGHLCDTFSIGTEDRLKNWTQYLYWQGKTILSADEACFWRTQLGGNYESLPAIGFQLCCADYMQDCVPLHLEDLLYDSRSKLCNNGYYEFWTANQRVIRKQSEQLAQTYRTIITQYRQQWRHAKEYFYTGKKWLNSILEKQIPVDLCEFSSIPECNQDELKRLILETEFQLAVCNEARRTLMRLCKQVYNLDSHLFSSNLIVENFPDS